jgi:Fe-S cluster assembly scaffold protein SufB
MRHLENKPDVDPEIYEYHAEKHAYIEKLTDLDERDTAQLLDVGVETDESGRSATFLQKDNSVIHCKTCQDGIEVMGINQALNKHDWLSDYYWKSVPQDQDAFTKTAKAKPHEGYFIRARAGVKSEHPVQSCLYIGQEDFSQNVHNLVVAEENSELHIITGCATAPHLVSGMHIGISEFFVKKGAKLVFTMIHDWGEKINVRPRTVTRVEAGGVIISNYISLRPVGNLQMFPTTYLDGEGAVARFNSVLVAAEGSHLDVGSRVVMNAPGTKAEIISRGITSGGTILARGDLIGRVAGVKAHLECKGLILKDGLMHAIPELRGYVPGVEMSHEAAVGKIDQREIEYLMARGLTEEEAIATIVRGFLNVDVEGLPPGLKSKLDHIVAETEKDML